MHPWRYPIDLSIFFMKEKFRPCNEARVPYTMKPVQRPTSHFFTGLIAFDVGIVGDRIEAVGRLGRERAERRINAEARARLRKEMVTKET